MLVNDVCRAMEAAIGALSPKKAQDMASSLMQGQGKDQLSKAAQDLMEWSSRNRNRLTELVRSEVRSQLKQVGVASRDEVDALRRRVRELEKVQASPKRAAAKRTTAKRATARRAPRPDAGTSSPAAAETPAEELSRIEISPPAGGPPPGAEAPATG
jgi:hypothetical protein